MDIFCKKFLVDFVGRSEKEADFLVYAFERVENVDGVIFIEQQKNMRDDPPIKYSREDQENIVIKQLECLDRSKYVDKSDRKVKITFKVSFPDEGHFDRLKNSSDSYEEFRDGKEQIKKDYEERAEELVKHLFPRYFLEECNARGHRGNVKVKMNDKGV